MKKIIANFKDNIRLSTPVQKIKRKDKSISIISGSEGQEDKFDAVVIATHSNQALKLLEKPTAKEKEILSLLPYQHNDAILHKYRSVC